MVRWPGMRRVARRLFAVCSAVSLLLCVAICGLGVRSYWPPYVFHREWNDVTAMTPYEGEA